MAAGLGFKTFNTGDVLSAADVNGYLMQGVLVFADATARDAAITSPQEGQFAYTKNNDSLWYYSGSAWVASGATGDIEGVTAGTGISGGGTSGTVTITNSMATAIDAKGDLVVGTGADTFSRLAVGTNTYVLTADSAEATGLKWAAASGGGLTYSTWSPTYTNLTIGNGTVTAKYAQSGKFVHAYWTFTLGSTSSVGGDPRMTLPISLATAKTTAGICAFHDSGVAAYSGMISARYTSSTSEIVFYRYTTAGQGQMSEPTATAPFSWTTGDEMWFSIVYEGV